MRPVAAEYDEKEETPWEVIFQEAANIGLYSWEAVSSVVLGPDRARLPDRERGALSWGCAGITLALMGSTLGVSGIVGNGTPGADRRVGAAVLRHARRHPPLGVGGIVRARRRVRRVEPTHARSTTRRRTSG